MRRPPLRIGYIKTDESLSGSVSRASTMVPSSAILINGYARNRCTVHETERERSVRRERAPDHMHDTAMPAYDPPLNGLSEDVSGNKTLLTDSQRPLHGASHSMTVQLLGGLPWRQRPFSTFQAA